MHAVNLHLCMTYNEVHVIDRDAMTFELKADTVVPALGNPHRDLLCTATLSMSRHI